MDQKLTRVPSGGLFHSHKVKYSVETEKLIRELIRESKLSIFQRQKVEESIKKGEPLPLPPSKTARGISRKHEALETITKKYEMPRRRKKEAIQLSGAYERNVFIPTYDRANHAIEKAKLQEVMAYGRTLKSGKPRKEPQSIQFEEDDGNESGKTKKNQLSKETILDEIADDIEDRKQFLARMESIGQGKQYREIIRHEIQEKLKVADDICKKFDIL